MSTSPTASAIASWRVVVTCMNDMLPSAPRKMSSMTGTMTRSQGSASTSLKYVGFARDRAMPGIPDARAGIMAAMLRAMQSPFRIPSVPFGRRAASIRINLI